jgi:hypothetical protein
MAFNINGDIFSTLDANIVSSTNVVDSGLILHLNATDGNSYDGAGGSTWYDLTANGYNGTLVNSPTFSTSYVSNFAFNYSNNYVTTTGMANYAYTNGVTMCVWHKNGGGTGAYRGVVTNGISGDRIGGFEFRYGRENYYGGTNNGTSLYFNITNSAGTTTGITTYAPLSQWHFYSATYDNTTLKTYVDGGLFTSAAHASGGQLKTESGSTIIGVSPGTAEYLDGNLSIVMIYNRALTAKEIIQNYQATRSKFEQYYDCGYGCSLYSYDPGCTHC